MNSFNQYVLNLSDGSYFEYSGGKEEEYNKILNKHYFFYYMPLEVTDILVPMPFGGNMFFKDAPETYVLLFLSLLYISIFCFFAVRKFEKEDL